ncbi:hypothetical protein DFQ28_002100 [Apophysomyces sp. BC1034]|nr:hypothetical protein DFQ30_010329 [Apophysomyces sp. BC1015]KAG0181279.1 hypothetical protein DFQ29_008806 [Apophysomyces sp. BC1021]KAG0193991.1 hypothetical protein DFQ28_002100 [Apophysomyces sp. BC1034]
MPFENLLQVVANCDNFPYERNRQSTEKIHQFVPFRLGLHVIGHVLPEVVAALKEYSAALSPSPFELSDQAYISFSSWVDSFDKRTGVVKKVMDEWREQRKFKALAGWRNEIYPVYGDFSRKDNVAFVMERAATPLLGVSTFGVQLNGYVREQDGSIKLWVARRVLTKPTWSGMLDSCAAGGITYKYSTKETIVKECDEEAYIPSEIAQNAYNVGVISYYIYTSSGLQPETVYVYDLQLPSDFMPTPRDGEVECFYLWSLEKVMETLLNGEWKPNCALVAIDFMMRNGMITADSEPDYIDISYRLHRRLEFPGPRKYA